MNHLMKAFPILLLATLSVLTASCELSAEAGPTFATAEILSAEEFAELTVEERKELLLALEQRTASRSANTQPGNHIQKVTTRPTQGERIWHDIIDPKSGRVSEQVLLPAAWQISPRGWQHPNGTTFNSGPNKRYIMQQAPYANAQQLIDREIIPDLKRNGLQVSGTRNLPMLAHKEDERIAYTWQQYPMQVKNQVMEIEFTHGTTKGLLIVYFAVGRHQAGGYTAYWSNVLRAPANYFQQAKSDVLYALRNARQPQEWIAYYNQQQKNRAYGAAARHQSRMRERERAFAAHQSSQRTLSEVSDIYHDMYKNTSAMRDAGQQKNIDAIREEMPRVNPHTGQTNRVPQGYTYYFVSPQGQWIGTNDALYDPNLDPNYRQQNWQRANRPGGSR